MERCPMISISAFIFIKVIGQNLSDSAIGDLYTWCRMNFVVDPIQTQTSHFMDLGIQSSPNLKCER